MANKLIKTRAELVADFKAIVVKAQAVQAEIVERFRQELGAELHELITKGVPSAPQAASNGTNGTSNGHVATAKPFSPQPKPTAKAPRKRSRPSAKVSVWTASQEAKRVPDFVLEATKCANKAEVVARFGLNAVFTDGQPLPDEQPVQAQA